MAAELAASERLNYLSKKQRAVSSRHSRLIYNANNGNEFTTGSITNIQISGGQAATYMDFQNSYLRFTVENHSDKEIKIASAYDLIDRLEILADGQTISNISHYGVLVNQYLATECGTGWLDRFGHLIAGTTSNPFGADGTLRVTQQEANASQAKILPAAFGDNKVVNFTDIPGTGATAGTAFMEIVANEDIEVTFTNAGGMTVDTSEFVGTQAAPVVTLAAKTTAGVVKSKTFCIPLVLTPFFMVNKYIPLVGRSNLQFRITWCESRRGVVVPDSNTAPPASVSNGIRYSPVDFIVSAVRLSAEANAMVMANTGGRFELITTDCRTAVGQHNITTDSSVALNCGFSFSSLDRISFAFYPTLDAPDRFGQQNRGCGALTNYALAVNGEEYPRKRIDLSLTNIGEPVAEVGIAHRSLADFNHQCNLRSEKYYLENPSGVEYAKLGDFVAMLDTESMQPHTGDSLYSGISTLGSVVQLVGDSELSSDTNNDNNQQLLVFAQFTAALTLDMNGTQTWVVSI